MPRTLKMSFGVEPSDGPDDEIYSTPLMLRWIARWTSDWIRSGIVSQIEARRRVHFCSPPADGGRLVRGGRGAAELPLPGAAGLPCT